MSIVKVWFNGVLTSITDTIKYYKGEIPQESSSSKGTEIAHEFLTEELDYAYMHDDELTEADFWNGDESDKSLE